MGEQCGDLLQLADVAGKRFGCSTRRDDLVDHALAIRLLAAGDNDVRAVAGEQFGNFGPDAAAGTGDECDLAG